MEEKKNNKHRLTKAEREERKFNKDLKDCMRCKFFWGNDSRCINSNCFKEKRKEPEKTVRSECTDCSYKRVCQVKCVSLIFQPLVLLAAVQGADGDSG